jgi:hypothetical protein
MATENKLLASTWLYGHDVEAELAAASIQSNMK